MHKILVTGLALVLATPAFGGWTLDGDTSSLSFVSTKAGTIAEVHRFGELSGTIDDDGKATLRIALGSIDTAIEIRDERMRELLFETAQFPEATVTLSVPASAMSASPDGSQSGLTLEAELNLHGATTPVSADVVVARLGEGRLLVASTRPVVVDGAKVGLTDGIEKLRAVAGLTAISPSVPVTFLLVFERD
jgi:polyisoprenoid-binding protein YceI